MLLDFSIYTPLYVSFMWALILFSTCKANRARFFLGIFMFAVGMIFLSHVIYYHHLNEIYLYFDLIFVFGSLSIFPIYHWYMKVLTFRSKIDFRDMKLLLPAFAMLAANLVVYLFMTKESRDLYVNDYLYGNGNWESASMLIKILLVLGYMLQIIYLVQIIFSFLKIRVFIADYNDNIANFYSNLEDKTLQWPKLILYSFVVTSIFTIITSFLGRSFFDKWPLILLFTCIVYSVFLFVLGYLGYMQNHSIVTLEQDSKIEIKISCENPNDKKTKSQLLTLFEKEQVFKQKDLKISDIALKLHTNRTYISTLINQEYDCSFNTFVNQYRVAEAKDLLRDENNNKLSIEHISTLAGFGSIDSFIRAFKTKEGITPGNFRRSAQHSET
jgi:AraC-like DNA-binding protein